MPDFHRQGDVFLIRVKEKISLKNAEKIPPEKGRHILAEGEQTGHHHAIDASQAQFLMTEKPLDKTLTEDGPARYIVVKKGQTAVLNHEEHAPQLIEAGIYRVSRKREYDILESRYVAD